MFVIVDPVNPQTNTARNSHRTPEILNKFQQAFSHLKSIVQGEYLRLQQLSKLQQLAGSGADEEVSVPTEEQEEENDGAASPVDKGAAAAEEQQQLPSASADPDARPSAPSSGPQQSSPSFFPGKSGSSGFSGAAQVQEQLSVKPFFFAQVNFMRRFLRSDDEIAASVEPAGESRPVGADDATTQARSGSADVRASSK